MVPPVLAMMNAFWFWKIAKGLIKTLSKARHSQWSQHLSICCDAWCANVYYHGLSRVVIGFHLNCISCTSMLLFSLVVFWEVWTELNWTELNWEMKGENCKWRSIWLELQHFLFYLSVVMLFLWKNVNKGYLHYWFGIELGLFFFLTLADSIIQSNLGNWYPLKLVGQSVLWNLSS